MRKRNIILFVLIIFLCLGLFGYSTWLYLKKSDCEIISISTYSDGTGGGVIERCK